MQVLTSWALLLLLSFAGLWSVTAAVHGPGHAAPGGRDGGYGVGLGRCTVSMPYVGYGTWCMGAYAVHFGGYRTSCLVRVPCLAGVAGCLSSCGVALCLAYGSFAAKLRTGALD